MKKAILLTMLFVGLLFIQTPKVTAQKQTGDCVLKMYSPKLVYSPTCNCQIWVNTCVCGPGFCFE